MGKAKPRRAFVLTAELPDPDARMGRRKRARERAAAHGSEELAAEKAPRVRHDASPTAKAVPAPCLTDEPGRKKKRRLEILEGKRAQKENRKVQAQAKEAVGSKSPGDRSAATELLKKFKGREQQLLASVAERISAEPEKELELFDVFFELHCSGDARSRLLAVISAAAVFRDLIPGYRIREPTEAEKRVQRSKEVLNLEKYEQLLLKTYNRLLPLIDSAAKHNVFAVAPVLASLVKSAADFNCHQRLLSIAIKHANGPDSRARRVLVESLKDVVGADQRLEASRAVVLAVGRLAQSAAQKQRQPSSGILCVELLEVLLHVPFGKAEAAALEAAAEVDEELRRELNESSIKHDAEHLRKAESELLTEIFVVYLRILRQRHLHGRHTLAAVLAGLARWGQRVNLELLLEILSELQKVVMDAISQGDELVSLQGLNSVMVLLSGPAQALTTTDLSWLADGMQKALSLAAVSLSSSCSETSWPPVGAIRHNSSGHELDADVMSRALEGASVPALVLKCLASAVRCPQAYGQASDSALAALIEELFNLIVMADPYVAQALLRETAMLLRKHRQLHTLLDSEGGIFRLGGLTDRAVSVAWHLHPLKFSILPELATGSSRLSQAVVSRLGSVSNLFPIKDMQQYFSMEFAHHLTDILSAPSCSDFLTEGKKVQGSAILTLEEFQTIVSKSLPRVK